MNAARKSNELNQVIVYLNYCGTISNKNKAKEFFDCIRVWQYGDTARRGFTLKYTDKLNVKVTKIQSGSVNDLVRQGIYGSISAFLRLAIDDLLYKEHDKLK